MRYKCCVLEEHVTLDTSRGFDVPPNDIPADGAIDTDDAVDSAGTGDTEDVINCAGAGAADAGDVSREGTSEEFALVAAESWCPVAETTFDVRATGVKTPFFCEDLSDLTRMKFSFSFRRSNLAMFRTASDLCTRRFKM